MLFRYAPTPSGFLHLGNAVNFVLNYLSAKQMRASILLRIDDLDADRKRQEYVEDVFVSLEWLGLTYDIGPTGPDDFERNWSQRHRIHIYQETLDQLVQCGVVYASDFSRQQIRAIGDFDAIRLMRGQNLPLSTPEVPWRVCIPDDEPFTDFVVRRRDGIPAYQIASLSDDLYFGVTHLVRGEDLRNSTLMQCYLATLLGNNRFTQIKVWHHPLVTDAFGEKLSKSAGSASLKALREANHSPIAVYREVARLLGKPEDVGNSLESLAQAFDLTRWFEHCPSGNRTPGLASEPGSFE